MLPKFMTWDSELIDCSITFFSLGGQIFEHNGLQGIPVSGITGLIPDVQLHDNLNLLVFFLGSDPGQI